MLTEGQCFCHIPCVYLSGKDGQKVYTKCGRSKQDMKSGVRGCTLFCDEEEWTCVQAAVNCFFPEGFQFEDDWPVCGHGLKVRVSTKRDGSGCFLRCRLGLYDPDHPCDFCRWIPLPLQHRPVEEPKIKKRKLTCKSFSQ